MTDIHGQDLSEAIEPLIARIEIQIASGAIAPAAVVAVKADIARAREAVALAQAAPPRGDLQARLKRMRAFFAWKKIEQDAERGWV
jgi:hypothetical protein